MATLIGKTLGSYVVEDEIGSGGMGEVLLARQTSLDRPAVIKKIRRDLCELPDLLERFRREARVAAAIHHQNVVAVYDCFSWRGGEFIAQEYVDGVDLSTALARCGPMPWRVASMICLEIVRGLQEIHAHGTVHRDLKPQNILLGRRGEVKIADFGLALEASGSSLTKTGVMIGSPPYMPPEQMLGERVDARCDLFSVGVILYELLSGCLPYPEPEEDETEGLLSRMQREKYLRLRKRRPGTPRFLARMVRGCLRAKARNRIPNATEIRRRLDKALGEMPPEDMRGELTAWLWENQVFDTRENETVVRIVERAPESARKPGAWGWGPGLAVCAATVAGILLVDLRPPEIDSPASLLPQDAAWTQAAPPRSEAPSASATALAVDVPEESAEPLPPEDENEDEEAS